MCCFSLALPVSQDLMTGGVMEWRHEVLGRGFFLQYRLQTNGLLLQKCLNSPVASLTLLKVQWKYMSAPWG